jgi:hypothetical protein
LEQLAGAATDGPWVGDPDGCIVRPSPLAHGTIHVISTEVHSFNVVMRQEDEDWLTTMNPLVANPLVNWLRDSAACVRDELEQVTDSSAEAAVEFARLILGEPVPGEDE